MVNIRCSHCRQKAANNFYGFAYYGFAHNLNDQITICLCDDCDKLLSEYDRYVLAKKRSAERGDPSTLIAPAITAAP